MGRYEAPLAFPGIEYRLHETPGSLHSIGAIEKGGIPTHGIIQKRSISAAFAGTKSGPIAEIHSHARQAHLLSGQFDVKADGDAFLGLDIQDQCIGIDSLAAKEQVRSTAEVDGDFGDAARHALAGTNIERNVCPAPVINE